MGWKALDDMDLRGKRVLVRVDINVPVENGKVTDDTRIQRIIPTLRDILEQGGTPVLLAHFGRPKGKRVQDLSLRVVLPALEAALGRKVVLAETLEAAEAGTEEINAADVLLLENIRFYPGETENDPDFAKRLAGLGDIYCNDAFSAAHRAHASTEGVARLLPSCAGRLMQAELSALEAALATPKRPVGAVVGGAKVSTKIELLENLVNRLDLLVIGGGMANTLLAANGVDVGKSLCEHDLTDTVKDILAAADEAGCTVHLPYDVVVAKEFAANPPSLRTCNVHEVGADEMILDIGPQATEALGDVLKTCGTLVWNGPLGAFETPPFDEATVALAKTAAALTQDGSLVSVAGGGDTVAALAHASVTHDVTYVSTAGGAFLEWMEGKELPGVAALSD